MDAFPFVGRRCERMTDAVLQRLTISNNFRERFRAAII
jgi:hypothetical protein